MGNKIYRVNETQFQNVLETLKKEREVVNTESNNVNETITGSDNIFENEFGYMQIDEYDKGGFKQHVFGAILGNYNVDYSIRHAKVTYTIELEYRSYGIKNIYVSPNSVLLMGELIIDNENDTETKEFEIEYDTTGLKTNTLSGQMKIGNDTVTINDLPKTAVFESKHTETSSGGVSVDSLEIESGSREMKFIFQY